MPPASELSNLEAAEVELLPPSSAASTRNMRVDKAGSHPPSLLSSLAVFLRELMALATPRNICLALPGLLSLSGGRPADAADNAGGGTPSPVK
ncbi:hypothetical protein VM1G_11391 [Cytospora mali]|uniref:Uncharacterized protein n=1 Tax=Cytospora mali TaxID=578113 RepID=A0A194VP67_CYTMA|nr:hypothetical protein VM1G_11391 [Valsa mali]